MSLSRRILPTLVAGALLGGCATNDPNRQAKTGAAVGAVLGAVVGHQLDDKAGRWVGAAVGALAGAGVGGYMDKQQREFEQDLSNERARHQIEVQRMRDDTLKVNLDSEVSFDYDSAIIKPTFLPTLDKLAGLIAKYNQTVVHIVGHTDSTGSDAINNPLSINRAASVRDYLAARGVPISSMTIDGRGSREPVASNDTPDGRAIPPATIHRQRYGSVSPARSPVPSVPQRSVSPSGQRSTRPRPRGCSRYRPR